MEFAFFPASLKNRAVKQLVASFFRPSHSGSEYQRYTAKQMGKRQPRFIWL